MTVSDKQCTEILHPDGARRDRSAVLVRVSLSAQDRLPANEVSKGKCRLLPTAIALAGGSAHLIGFGASMPNRRMRRPWISRVSPSKPTLLQLLSGYQPPHCNMCLGQIVETATAQELFRNPGHPYTRALLSAIPKPDPDRRSAIVSLEGELPDPTHLPRVAASAPDVPS
jgi:hypothetical protein